MSTLLKTRNLPVAIIAGGLLLINVVSVFIQFNALGVTYYIAVVWAEFPLPIARVFTLFFLLLKIAGLVTLAILALKGRKGVKIFSPLVVLLFFVSELVIIISPFFRTNDFEMALSDAIDFFTNRSIGISPYSNFRGLPYTFSLLLGGIITKVLLVGMLALTYLPRRNNPHSPITGDGGGAVNLMNVKNEKSAVTSGKFCTACGAAAALSSAFCGKCGAALS